MPERIGHRVGGGREPEDERAERERREAFRDTLSAWPTGVALLAVREGDDGAIHALTVGSFIPVSVDPPLVLASLGSNASALPYLDSGTPFCVSVLRGDQRGLASRYADTHPVGPSPFPDRGPPVVRDALAALVCQVDELLPRGDHTLVIGRVLEARPPEDGGGAGGEGHGALAYFRRRYHSLG